MKLIFWRFRFVAAEVVVALTYLHIYFTQQSKMNALIVLAFVVSGVSAFSMRPSFKASSALCGMKPQFDGTMKEAGAHLEQYVLEHENGARAIVDTKTATCISWVDQNGVQVIGSAASVHMFPDSKTPLGGHFVPEERAKKVSFDRMIFKNEDGAAGLEYRCDVTMRADSLEYDIVIKNATPEAISLSMGLAFNIDAAAAAKGAKVVAKKAYTEQTDSSVATGTWVVPVGKFKETEFYVKISSTSA